MEYKVYFRRPHGKLGMYMIERTPGTVDSICDAVKYIRDNTHHITALGVVNGHKRPIMKNNDSPLTAA